MHVAPWRLDPDEKTAACVQLIDTRENQTYRNGCRRVRRNGGERKECTIKLWLDLQHRWRLCCYLPLVLGRRTIPTRISRWWCRLPQQASPTSWRGSYSIKFRSHSAKPSS